MNNPPRVEASLTTRLQIWFRALPLVTKTLFCSCISLSVLALLTGFDLAHPACLSAQLVVERLQIFRIVTSAFVHSGILHLAFNMFAFVPIAASLERQFGSVQFAYSILLFMLLGDILFILCTYAFDWLLHSLAACAVGLSGVIFALVVVDTHLSSVPQRSIFGFFSIPAPYFPWALLGLWQLLLPHVSFFGHLGGILAGQMYVKGWLQRLMPSSSAFQAAERAFPLCYCVQQDAFISYTGGPVLPTSISASDSGLQRSDPRSQSGWLRAPSLQGWLPLPMGEPQQANSAAQSATLETAEPSKAAGKGVVLGGAHPASPVDPPNLAAAAAAEARAARGFEASQSRARELPLSDRGEHQPFGHSQEESSS